MDLSLLKEIILVILFFLVLFAVLLPLKFADSFKTSGGIDIYQSERYSALVSILNCFAAGIFLGTCLLHLFPDVRENVTEAMKHIDPTQTFPFAEFTIAMGFFLLLTIEQVISDIRERKFLLPPSYERSPILGDNINSRGNSDDSISETAPNSVMNHEVNVSIRCYAMLLALSIHSTFEGIAIGVQNNQDSVIQITGAMIIHKVVIAFSLGLNLSQSPLTSLKSLIASSIFALTAPVGIGIGLFLSSLETLNGSIFVASLQGLAAGSFLYVIFFEVLPQEFRTGHMHLPKLLSFIIGFSVICGVLFLFPENT